MARGIEDVKDLNEQSGSDWQQTGNSGQNAVHIMVLNVSNGDETRRRNVQKHDP